ncbi:MAG: bZIP transcription factor [Candidatus Acidiferrales bacterium]
MHRQISRAKLLLPWILYFLAGGSGAVFAQSSTKEDTSANSQSQVTSEVLKKVDQLVQQNEQLEKQNQDLVAEIKSLRQILAKQDGVATNPPAGNLAPDTNANRSTEEPTRDNPSQKQSVSSEQRANTADEEFAAQEEPSKWGTYTPNAGFKVADTEHGDLSVSIYTYGRYLNQLGLAATYTDAFGNVKNVQRRQDFQLNKVQIKFLGWILSEKFRYFLYAWTSNASQGLGAQVVLAGNLNYAFNKHLNVGVGIRSLPGTRSVEGNFPFWLGVDTRLIADEFFRPSYTSGVWAWGKVADRLDYIAMVGNNLSTLGVSAAQLNNNFSTVSTALVWMPTTGEFGQGFGDFEHHESLATRLAAHFTRSDEDTQSQPNSNQFENTQIRLEDGTVIFTPNIFGPGITVTDLIYKMASFDGGLKYRGFSLDGEYFMRWLDNFKGPGTAGLPTIFSRGFQMQASAMVVPKTLQLYLGGSSIYGKFGNPFDFRAGVNFFPFHNKVVRWNTEFLYLQNSPVGYTAVPFAIGGNGPVFHTNLELAF